MPAFSIGSRTDRRYCHNRPLRLNSAVMPIRQRATDPSQPDSLVRMIVLVVDNAQIAPVS